MAGWTAAKACSISLHALVATPGDWRATVSGIGPDHDAAQALAAELALSDRVAFTGYAAYEDAPALYRAYDVFVSPTYAEGFSNTVLEAMASGLAVVSCHAVGVVDCLADGVTGLMSEPGDVPALTAALAQVIGEPALRERLATAALAECRRTYSWEAVGAQIMAVYDGLRGQPQPMFDEALPLTPCRFRSEPQLL